jgi:hypothetical protein
MTRNVGSTDRTLRIVVGLALIVSAVAGWFTPWGYVGVVPLLTALVGFCPAYTLVGLNTCSVAERKA